MGRADAPILRDIVILDCPDPDTTESETPGSNLALLHKLLPHCDVLIYTSTQQKYRSARVGDTCVLPFGPSLDGRSCESGVSVP